MKKVFYFMTIITAFLFLGSCNSDDNNDLYYPVGGFTMVNAYTGSEAIYYSVDGRPVQSIVAPLTYQKFGYINLWQGKRSISISDRVNVLANVEQAIVENVFYTSFMGGSEKNKTHFITEDRITSIVPDKENGLAAFRFFNLSGDDVEVSLQFNDEVLRPEFQNRKMDTEETSKQTQTFITIPGKEYTLKVVNKEGEVLVEKKNVKILNKGFYTAMLIGSKENGNKPYYLGILEQPVN